VNRLHQVILIGSSVLASWLGMQAVHEFGHVLGAGVTGGRLSRVVLHPLTISRTDLSHNPSPLVVVWAGPIIGVIAPLLVWAGAAAMRLSGAFVLRFFAGFCLLANGLYISMGSFDGIGDCGEMLRHGSKSWELWLFGAVTAPVGLWLWHRQGTNFGLGPANEAVNRSVAYGALLTCIAFIVVGLVVGKD
jgi:hypothetical protein